MKKNLVLCTSVFIALCFEIIILIAHPKQFNYLFPDNYTSVWNNPSFQIEMNGYLNNKDLLRVTSVDPQLHILSLNTETRSIGIYFKEPISKNFTVQVFYPDIRNGGGYTEQCSISKKCLAGDSNIYFEIPAYNYPNLRIDINGDCKLEKILLSREQIIKLPVGLMYSFNPIRLGVLIAINLLFFIACNYHKQIFIQLKNQINKLKIVYRKKLFIGLLYIGEILGFSVMLALGVSIVFHKDLNIYIFLFINAIVFLCIYFIKCRKELMKYPERAFLVVSIVLGSLIAISLPHTMLVSWDDETHFERSLSLSYLGEEKVPLTGADLTMINRMNPVTFDIKDEYRTLDQQFKQGVVSYNEPVPFIKLYNFIGYLPFSLGLFLGRLFHLPYNGIFLLGRVSNVIFYSLIIYFAIKTIKSGQLILAVVGLLPTNLFLAANYSYDAWVTAWIMLGFAYFVKELQEIDQPIRQTNLVVMILAFVIGLGPKAIYCPLILLLLLLPPHKFKNWRKLIVFRLGIIIIFALLISSFLIPFIVKDGNIVDPRLTAATELDPIGQIRFIFMHPFYYFKIVITFMSQYLSLDSSKDFLNIWAYMGMTDYNAYLLCLITYVTFIDRDIKDRNICGIKVKVTTTLLSLITIVAIITVFYVSSPLGGTEIRGCQPRYLLPLLCPILYVMGSSKIEVKLNKVVQNSAVFGSMIVILLNGLWDLCIRYY